MRFLATACGGGLSSLGYAVRGGDSERELAALMGMGPRVLLFDVRYRAHSRWFPAWNKGALQARWGDRYIHERRLGNVNYRFPDAPIQLLDPEPALRRAVSLLSQGYLLVVLCACTDYSRCHRKVVVDSLVRLCQEVASVPVVGGVGFDASRGVYEGTLAGGQYRMCLHPAVFAEYRSVVPVEQLCTAGMLTLEVLRSLLPLSPGGFSLYWLEPLAGLESLAGDGSER